MHRRLKVSTESTLRPAPPSTRVLVTATWQMVGVHNRGSAPEPVELAGWSSELKVRPAPCAAQSREAPCRAETALIWRANSLTWRLVGAQEGRNDRKRRCRGAVFLSHRKMLKWCLLLASRRAGGGVDGGRWGTARMPTGECRWRDASSMGVVHGCGSRRRTERWKAG